MCSIFSIKPPKNNLTIIKNLKSDFDATGKLIAFLIITMQHQKTNIEALIVEDEIDICYLLKGILKNKNLHTNCAGSINEAVKSLQTYTPSILFLDNHLPDGKGIDLIGTVKRNHPQIKIVMITAHDTSDDKEKAISKGADFFIGKPFTRETIYNTLDVLLGKTG